MPPNRFSKREVKREVTPFNDVDLPPVTAITAEIPAEWRKIEAPPNFTWVSEDELAGMGWPKSRDQVRFIVDQGIDHLITLSADKIPPQYAFPELQWSLIPVEDFHGPAMRDIQKFIGIMDEARRHGEAVGVHCAEGRGRTGVMCACYLIYYHDIKPWDAIRIMRRQRPGSVERRTQEETVVRFYQILQHYGKSALENLEEREKEWKELQRRRRDKVNLMNYENKMVSHTSSFYKPESTAERLERMQRMQRSKSLPKMTQEVDEAEKMAIQLKQHLQSFFCNDREGSLSRDNKSSKSTAANTPNKSVSGSRDNLDSESRPSLRDRVDGLKKIKRPTTRDSSPLTASDSRLDKVPNALSKHLQEFRNGKQGVQRVRSFSQPKDKEANKERNDKVSNGKSDDKEEMKQVKKTNSKELRHLIENTVNTAVQALTQNPFLSDPSKLLVMSDNEGEGKRDEAIEVKVKVVDVSDLIIDNEDKSESEDSGYGSRKPSRRRKSRLNNRQDEVKMLPSASSSSLSSSKSSDSDDSSEFSRPSPPSYRPKYTVDSSSTYSYYTRVRSRAKAKALAEARKKEHHDGHSAIQTATLSVSKDYRRAKTVDRDLCVTVTVHDSDEGIASGSLAPKDLSEDMKANVVVPRNLRAKSCHIDTENDASSSSYSRKHSMGYFSQTSDAFISGFSSYRVRSRLRRSSNHQDIHHLSSGSIYYNQSPSSYMGHRDSRNRNSSNNWYSRQSRFMSALSGQTTLL